MSFEWLVALRYLRSPNRPAVLRIVTLLAVIGVAAGVTTLVIALSMNTGFRQAIRDRLLSVTAHVNLKPISPNGVRDYRELMTSLSGTPGVEHKLDHICWDGCMFPNATMEDPETWRTILQTMIQVRNAHGWN